MIQEKNENINKQTNNKTNKQTKPPLQKKENETNNAEKIIPIDIEHQIHF